MLENGAADQIGSKVLACGEGYSLFEREKYIESTKPLSFVDGGDTRKMEDGLSAMVLAEPAALHSDASWDGFCTAFGGRTFSTTNKNFRQFR